MRRKKKKLHLNGVDKDLQRKLDLAHKRSADCQTRIDDILKQIPDTVHKSESFDVQDLVDVLNQIKQLTDPEAA